MEKNLKFLFSLCAIVCLSSRKTNANPGGRTVGGFGGFYHVADDYGSSDESQERNYQRTPNNAQQKHQLNFQQLNKPDERRTIQQNQDSYKIPVWVDYESQNRNQFSNQNNRAQAANVFNPTHYPVPEPFNNIRPVAVPPRINSNIDYQFQGHQAHGQNFGYNLNGNEFINRNPYESPVRAELKPQVTQQSSIRRSGSGGKIFLTNAFFSFDNKKSNAVSRKWSEEDEMKWQATTKAPYFENKVPGLECTLPASAVLEATTALKASSLLPLDVPVGKPILSCNATELLQAQIYLNGITYDCDQSEITLSCPRLDANNLIVDDCHGDILECDVGERQKPKSISCTNGTLISNYPIVCKSATIMEKKNILNCFYSKQREVPRSRSEFESVPQTTASPFEKISQGYVPPLEDDQKYRNDGFDWRIDVNKQLLKRSSGL